MHTAIESEAHRVEAKLVGSNAWGTDAIEFSTSSGTNTQEGRLWTEAANPARYELLCRAVKTGAVYDRDSGLWVKRTSLEAFSAYRAAQKMALEELVARNCKYATDVLGAKIVKDED